MMKVPELRFDFLTNGCIKGLYFNSFPTNLAKCTFIGLSSHS